MGTCAADGRVTSYCWFKLALKSTLDYGWRTKLRYVSSGSWRRLCPGGLSNKMVSQPPGVPRHAHFAEAARVFPPRVRGVLAKHAFSQPAPRFRTQPRTRDCGHPPGRHLPDGHVGRLNGRCAPKKGCCGLATIGLRVHNSNCSISEAARIFPQTCTQRLGERRRFTGSSLRTSGGGTCRFHTCCICLCARSA